MLHSQLSASISPSHHLFSHKKSTHFLSWVIHWQISTLPSACRFQPLNSSSQNSTVPLPDTSSSSAIHLRKYLFLMLPIHEKLHNLTLCWPSAPFCLLCCQSFHLGWGNPFIYEVENIETFTYHRCSPWFPFLKFHFNTLVMIWRCFDDVPKIIRITESSAGVRWSSATTPHLPQLSPARLLQTP